MTARKRPAAHKLSETAKIRLAKKQLGSLGPVSFGCVGAPISAASYLC